LDSRQSHWLGSMFQHRWRKPSVSSALPRQNFTRTAYADH